MLSVATNKPEAMARAILAGLGVDEVFVDVLGGDSVPVHKPDPEIVHVLARRTGISRTATILVGDSLVCAVTWGLTPAEVLCDASPDLVISRPAELLAAVG